MGKVYFRNGEFVEPVVEREEVRYEIHKNYILRTHVGVTTRITLDDMVNEMCSNKNMTDEDIERRRSKFIREFGNLLKDAPREILEMIREII